MRTLLLCVLFTACAAEAPDSVAPDTEAEDLPPAPGDGSGSVGSDVGAEYVNPERVLNVQYQVQQTGYTPAFSILCPATLPGLRKYILQSFSVSFSNDKDIPKKISRQTG